jgi:signal transduction histidine kinase
VQIFSNLPIKRKLMVITMLVSGVALAVASTAFVVFEQSTARKQMVAALEITAAMTAANSTAGLSFDEADSVEQALKSLSVQPDIAEACVYSKSGNLFARYLRAGQKDLRTPRVWKPGCQFENGRLVLLESINLAGETIGTIYLEEDLSQLNARLWRCMTIGLLVLAACAGVALFLSAWLQKVISAPLSDLANTVAEVRANKNYSVRATKQSNDELGHLIDGFNEMLAQIQERDSNLERRVAERTHELEHAHRQLLETSRLAGMAEVATSVLHNVGNVLNSINVSSTLALDIVKKSRINQLGHVAEMVRNHHENLAEFLTRDPKGSQLPGYLIKLTGHLAAEQARLAAEIELTRKYVDHVKEIVAMQQSYAKVSGVAEKVNVTDLVEDALRMSDGTLASHDVELIREYPEGVIECHTQRQKVLQVLVNLIHNAKHACNESGRPDKRITVRAASQDGRAQIIVIDNGIGIPAENLTRIFSHGFTTRPDGHGFGLHSGALAARELGGTLTGESNGRNTGARFVLDLPLQNDWES